MRPAVVAKVVRDGPRTFIRGLEDIEWGNASRYQTSMLATLTFAQQAGGDDADYVDLMGTSGLAFRLQVHQPAGCPSSPHPCCGFDCWKQALWACGREVDRFDTGKADPATIEKARAAIVASIDRGWPVIYASEEAGLVVGYVDGGKELLVRPYSPKGPGYVTTAKWPWQIIVLSARKAPPPRKDVLVNSLRLAVHFWRTPNLEQYASGQAAYDAWARQLDDDRRFGDLDAQALRKVCLANAYTYGSLELARGYAVTYLRSMLGDFSPAATEHLRKAADLYEKSHQTIDQGRPDIKCPWGLFPWDLKDGAEWSSGMRHTEAAVLREMAGYERQAVAEIQRALQAEGLPVALP